MSQQTPDTESNNELNEDSVAKDLNDDIFFDDDFLFDDEEDDNEENITVIDNDEALGAKKRKKNTNKESNSSSKKSSSSEKSSKHSSKDDSKHSSKHSSHSKHKHKHLHKKNREKITFSIDKTAKNIPVPKYRKMKVAPPKEEQEVKEETVEVTKKERSKAFKVFMSLGVAVMSLLIITASTLFVLIQSGRHSMLNGAEVAQTLSVPKNVVAEDDYIVYNGNKYRFNQDITTILFAGIDTRSESEQIGVLGTAGQADAIFVTALNTKTGESKILAVSRDSMVDVNVCDSAGKFLGTERLQICLAHAYGDGAESSSENLKLSVSRLLFGIPINAYFTLDLDAISILNDAVGGVTVDVIEDLTRYDSTLKKGERLTLKGIQAETYVRSRDVEGDENQNNLRMARQKNYLQSFIQKTVDMTKQDIRTPISLANSVQGYSQTDLTPDKITYLASIFANTSLSMQDDMIKVPGESVMGEQYAEYIVDTDKLFELILDTYYTRVVE